MPKDASKNVDRYKVRGGTLNEFDFHQAQGEVAARSTNKTKGTKGIKPAKAATSKKPAGSKSKKK